MEPANGKWRKIGKMSMFDYSAKKFDYIKREDAVWVLCQETCTPGPICPDFYCIEMWEKFKDVPSADVVEVVRCKDCKKVGVGGEGDTHYYICMPRGEAVDTDDFCSKGEWKDE